MSQIKKEINLLKRVKLNNLIIPVRFSFLFSIHRKSKIKIIISNVLIKNRLISGREIKF